MLEVEVGEAKTRGYVFISMAQYKREMERGGGKYYNVHAQGGIKRFRAKYMRDVKEVLNG